MPLYTRDMCGKYVMVLCTCVE